MPSRVTAQVSTAQSIAYFLVLLLHDMFYVCVVGMKENSSIQFGKILLLLKECMQTGVTLRVGSRSMNISNPI